MMGRTKALGEDPIDGWPLEEFYRPSVILKDRGPLDDRSGRPKSARPAHYKIVCISLYNQDIDRLESMVTELKRRGHTKANKSQLIRAALDQVDLDKIPKGY